MKTETLHALRDRAGEFAEHTTEAACACAIAMVQGQLLLLSAAHWAVALQTGLIAGTLSTILIAIGRATKPWIVSIVVGAVTTLADFLVHDGELIAVLIEAILTGTAAGLLALIVSLAFRRLGRHLAARARGAHSANPLE